MSRTWKIAAIGFVAAFVAVAGWFYVRERIAVSKVQPMPGPAAPKLPPGYVEPIHFGHMSSAERRDFLNADYKILWKMADLPSGVKKLLVVNGTSRLALADPGEKFEATDFIRDPELPRSRLIFAGVAGDRVFLHYESGGIAHTYSVELFQLKSPDVAVGLWKGYRGPAKDFEEMKKDVAEDDPCCDQ
jgi:hypothetical protein